MKVRLATAIALIAAPTFAQAPDAMKRSDPGAGNSIQCWDTQAAVVRDKNTSTGPKNDTSAVAGQQQKGSATTGSSTPTRPATPQEAANAKRPPGISDC
jgi:hypothetical protein